ncbi:MAG: DUF6273 domain-containing protein [Lachnospiraceae bacterium]|nr:DUF6273 domain-containing protein [Lachnospiraceae bacterium]
MFGGISGRKAKALLGIFLSAAVMVSGISPFRIPVKAETGVTLENPRISDEDAQAYQAGQSVTYDTIYFGEYPQSEVITEEMSRDRISEDGKIPEDLIVDDDLYEELEEAEWDSTEDVLLDGVWYRRLTGFDADWRYFRYEPIRWRVLAINRIAYDDSELYGALLLSDRVLDAGPYEAGEDALWEDSYIREWLNSVFIGRAFTQEEFAEDIIMVREEAAEGGFEVFEDENEDSANDVFLLSGAEVFGAVSEEYGFLKSSGNDYAGSKADEARQASYTVYARAAAAFSDDENLSGNDQASWWLRSSESWEKAWTVRADGTGASEDKYMATVGIRPAIWIDIETAEDEWTYAGELITEPSEGQTEQEPVANGTEEKELETEEDVKEPETKKDTEEAETQKDAEKPETKEDTEKPETKKDTEKPETGADIKDQEAKDDKAEQKTEETDVTTENKDDAENPSAEDKKKDEAKTEASEKKNGKYSDSILYVSAEWFINHLEVEEFPEAVTEKITVENHKDTLAGDWLVYAQTDYNNNENEKYDEDTGESYYELTAHHMRASVTQEDDGYNMTLSFGEMFDCDTGEIYLKDRTDTLKGIEDGEEAVIFSGDDDLWINRIFGLGDRLYAAGTLFYAEGGSVVICMVRELKDGSKEAEKPSEETEKPVKETEEASGRSEKPQKDVEEPFEETKKPSAEEPSGKKEYTDDEIVEMVRRLSGAPAAVLDSRSPDGILSIQCFENVKEEDGTEHTSTWGWYDVDPVTMTATDILGKEYSLLEIK